MTDVKDGHRTVEQKKSYLNLHGSEELAVRHKSV